MGYINRVNNMITNLEERIENLQQEIAETPQGDDRDYMLETLYELEQEQGECKAALFECAWEDGCEDPYEYFNY